MKVIVNDTNIFIDLLSIGLLEAFCRLPYEIHTVDFVVAEILEPCQRQVLLRLIEQNNVHVNSFTADELVEIYQEHSAVEAVRKKLSIQDCSVCYFARKHQIPMLTGDGRLRKYAENQNVEVHGILFVFDELVKYDIIPPRDASAKLGELQRINERLPKTEIQTRIDRWR